MSTRVFMRAKSSFQKQCLCEKRNNGLSPSLNLYHHNLPTVPCQKCPKLNNLRIKSSRFNIFNRRYNCSLAKKYY